MDSITLKLQGFCAQCGPLKALMRTHCWFPIHCTQPSFVHKAFHREFMAHVQDGKMKIWTKHWPSFLYDEGEYDRNNWERGLFKGYLLLQVHLLSNIFCTSIIVSQWQVYCHILTSPLLAIKKARKGTKPSKAQIYGMKCATGHTITYACILVRSLFF